jgi:LPXTG-motif cell wall-anchored protein
VSVKSFRSIVRRLSIVVAATSVGTAAVVALSATPAYAHTVTASGTKNCVNGNWVVTWTVANSQYDKFGVLTAVSHAPGSPALSTIVVDAQLPKKPATLTETVTLPGSTASASLTVTADWVGAPPKTSTAYLTLGGDCVPPAPEIDVDTSSDCDTLTVTVTNTGNVPATGTVTSGSKTDNFSLAAGAHTSFSYPGGAGVTATVTLTGGQPQSFEWKDPGDCPTPTTPAPTTPTTTEPGLPVTGSSLSTLILVAFALVVVGAALLFVLRYRRRVGES